MNSFIYGGSRRLVFPLLFLVGWFMGEAGFSQAVAAEPPLKLNPQGYFEAKGLNVLVFSNYYNELFDDSKISGIELIHQEVRTATNGDVRLNPTPTQWDPIPRLIARKVVPEANRIECTLLYPKEDFRYTLQVDSLAEGIRISVLLEKPLPPRLEQRAGFNLEFLPAAYFHKTF